MNKTLEMSLEDLQRLLDAQKTATADYITRNLTVYSHWQKSIEGLDLDKMKSEMKEEVRKSPYAGDFNVLKKYIKP